MLAKKFFVNLITAMRGASIIWLAHLLPHYLFAAILVVAGFAATDWIDGYFARRWNATTKFGAFFDPLVDKIFYLGSIFLLIPIMPPLETSLAPSLGEIFRQTFLPEFLLIAIRIPPLDKKLGIKTPATQYGKFKMICQSFALIEILFGLFLQRPDMITTGTYIAWGCVFLSFLSLTSHFWSKETNIA